MGMIQPKQQLEFVITLTAEELTRCLIGEHVETTTKIRGTELRIFVAIK